MNVSAIAIVFGAIIVAGLFAIVTILRNLYVCSPSEVLIFSGRRATTPDGKIVGFRVVRGGRAMRIPLIEVVDR
ncbi:MAG: flotillin family protein, partial [Deltaproteobacteria bacterium]